MPIVTVTSKRQLSQNVLTLNKLEKLCRKSPFLKWKNAIRMYIFSILGDERKAPKQDDLMMAVAEYSNDTYAIYPAEYLEGNEFYVIHDFLESFKNAKTIVVFDKITYDAVMKYSRGMNLSVHIS